MKDQHLGLQPDRRGPRRPIYRRINSRKYSRNQQQGSFVHVGATACRLMYLRVSSRDLLEECTAGIRMHLLVTSSLQPMCPRLERFA